MTEPSLSASERALQQRCGLRTWVTKKKTDVESYFPSIELIRDAAQRRTGVAPSPGYIAGGVMGLLDEEGVLLEHILKKGAVDISNDDDLWDRICLVAAKLIVQRWYESEDPEDG